ncbi:MAG: Efflux transporter, permease/ATP-binding protein [Myxococcaceae bacterium]|nr:Efflux transporter, permease/ATP-binding protein [Myxococcaceae bacterium]
MARFSEPLPPDAPTIPRPRARAVLGRLLGLTRPERPTLALALLFLLVGSAGSVLFPQAIRGIVDGAIARHDRAALGHHALFLFAVFVVQGAASGLRFALFSISGERVIARLRARLFDHLLGQDVAFFDARRTGDLTSSLASDAAALQTAVSTNVSMLLRNAVTAAGSLAMLFWTSPRLTLVMLAVIPAVAISAVVYGRRVRKLSRDAQDAVAESGAVAEEAFAGLRTVRLFVAEKTESARYAAAVGRAFALARARAVSSGAFMAAVTTAGFSAIALVIWYGGLLVFDGRLTVGQLMSFLIYTLTVAFSLGALADLWGDFMRAAGAAERVFELLDRAPTIPVEGGATPARVDGRVELAGVDFTYPARPDAPVLRGVSLTVAPGEVVAVVGQSGAGKSTLAHLLTRFYDPTAGTVSLDGHDLRALDPSWLRRHIGVVSQEPMLFSSSIAENIRYGVPGATDAEVESAARAANAHEFIARFPDGYATKVGERGVQLSGGQKQRVAIARAVLKNPRVLILDEATSALDAESEHVVQEALDRLLVGRTTLVIAHRLSTVQGADRVVVLDGGRVVQEGTHAALAAEAGLYRRLVERQFVAA